MIFRNLNINKIKLKNRVVFAPMCQYSAIKGFPTEWHYSHLSRQIVSGVGMLMTESVAVALNARITKNDLVLENSKQYRSFSKLFNFLKKINNIPIGIQISHAGRKGSSEIPWIKSNTPLKKEQGWVTFAPSAIKRDRDWPQPKKLSIFQIKSIQNKFYQTALKAKKIGFECLEIHMAHGYLLHQFLSPISNNRTDCYGGSLENRCRFALEIFELIRKVWPKNKILGARIPGSDYVNGGLEAKDSIYLVNRLKEIGIDYVCISNGGILPITNLKTKKNYNVNLAIKIKKETKVKMRVAGLITDPKEMKNILKDIDLIAIGRKMLNSPNWILEEARKEKVKGYVPNQYLRSF
jgi:2,4-dienoyl-CoA reductase-like NADH-dependent reductase (Old Yellow Enzyme family)